MSAMYCRIVDRSVGQAEKVKQWPADCVVCLHERKQTVTSQTRAEAIAHREKEHGWLADALRKRKRP